MAKPSFAVIEKVNLAEFQNPQQEPGMERRLLLVFALTFLVIVLFQPIIKKYFPQASPRSSTAKPEPGADRSTRGRHQSSPAYATDGSGAQCGRNQAGTFESETVVENDLYRIAFTNRGGQVKSWILKKFTDDKDQPLDLVNKAAAEKYGYPLSLWTYDESQRNKLNSALYLAPSSGRFACPGHHHIRVRRRRRCRPQELQFRSYLRRTRRNVGGFEGKRSRGLPRVARRLRGRVHAVLLRRQPNQLPVQQQL